MMEKIKRTKNASANTLPNRGNASRSKVTNIRIPKQIEKTSSPYLVKNVCRYLYCNMQLYIVSPSLRVFTERFYTLIDWATRKTSLGIDRIKFGKLDLLGTRLMALSGRRTRTNLIITKNAPSISVNSSTILENKHRSNSKISLIIQRYAAIHVDVHSPSGNYQKIQSVPTFRKITLLSNHTHGNHLDEHFSDKEIKNERIDFRQTSTFHLFATAIQRIC